MTRQSELAQAEFNVVCLFLNAATPEQNLNRVEPKERDVVLEYDLAHSGPGGEIVGPPYTLEFEVMNDPKPLGSDVLFSGIDNFLHAGNLTFNSYNQLYSPPYAPPDRSLRQDLDPRNQRIYLHRS
jgi:hypothetical protein